MTHTAIGADLTSIRITMRDPETLPSMYDFSRLFECVESLVLVSTVLAQIDPEERTQRLPVGIMISPDVLVSSQHIANAFRIGRVTYSSPVDILLLLGAGTTMAGSAAYVAVKKLMKLWSDTSDARIKHAEAGHKEADLRLRESDVNLAITLNNRKLQELSMAAIGSNLDRVDPDDVERRAVAKRMSQRVNEAAFVLLNADSVEVREG